MVKLYIVMVLENGDDNLPALLSYKCPSCGANLRISPDEIYVKCAFCGTTAQRQLTAEEQARATAKRLAKKVEQYKKDMHELKRLKGNMLSKIEDIQEFERKSKVETSFMRENPLVVPVIIAICGVLYLFGNGENKLAGLIGCLVAAAIVYFYTLNGKENAEKEASEAKSHIKPTTDELVDMKTQYDKIKKRFNVNAIPSQYRNDHALDYVIDLFNTEQASSLGEAFKRYDDHMHQKKMEAMQQEQIDLQKQQLEKMKEIQERQAYDYNDDNYGSSSVKTGAAVVGTILVAKIIKDLIDD